jgi:hypothetical protein
MRDPSPTAGLQCRAGSASTYLIIDPDRLSGTYTLRTIRGSNVPLRSRGVPIRTGPCSVASVFSVPPVRVLPLPPGGS